MKESSTTPNYTLLGIVLILLFLGITAIASASAPVAWENFGNTHYYLVHQLMFGIFPGLLAMLIFSRLDYKIWQKFAPLLLLAVLAMLIAVLIPGIGVKIGGARRWIDIGITYFQPSEVAKLALVVYLAAWFDKKQKILHDLKTGFIPSLGAVAMVAGLIFLQPDMGTLMVLALTTAAMFFTAGSQIRHLLGTGLLGLTALIIAIKSTPYRAARVITFLDPSHDPLGIGYHANQALIAIGAGGLLGYGYNQSLQKHNYLPETMGDSIFAIIAEEMGFIRSAMLIVLFLIFAWVGYNVAKKAPDNFGKLLAVGITSWVVVQAFINIGAMLAIIPLTGVPLPFISYGSSSMISILTGIGILLSISRKSRET